MLLPAVLFKMNSSLRDLDGLLNLLLRLGFRHGDGQLPSFIHLLMILQPFQPPLVWQVLNLEMFELGLKTVSVRACCHHADHHRRVVLHPAGTHHRVLLVIKGIEDFNGITYSIPVLI